MNYKLMINQDKFKTMKIHGGKRKGAGRKPKADEQKIQELSVNALTEVFGSEEEAFKYLAEQAKTSFSHLKMLFEYGYGKPKETIDLNNQTVPKPPKKHFIDFNRN